MDFENVFEMDDNDEDPHFQDNQCNGTIFLIDCKRSLFDITNTSMNGSTKSWFEAIIEGCVSVAKNKALNFGKDTLSLVFFGVTKTTDVLMKNVFIFQNMESISIESIHRLLKLQTITETEFEQIYGFSEECSLFYALWCCQHLFGKCKVKLSNKQILLFTNDDSPHHGSEDLKKRIFVKGRDLMETNTHIELVPITSAHGFQVDKFYKNLLLMNLKNGDENSLPINDPVSVIQELSLRIRHKQYKKRKLAHIKWHLGNDELVIGVAVYNMLRKTPSPAFTRLDRNTNTEVISKSATLLKDNNQLLAPFDMKYCLTIANKSISFEPEEVNKIRSVIDPGIRLLGFKPMKYLKPYYQMRTAQFLYPDESDIQGSINVFSALLIRCSERNLFALCVYVPRKSSLIRFVALVPQMEKRDKSGLQIKPPGFHVVFLPFEEDIRHLDLPSCSIASDSDKDMCKKLIRTLGIEYDPEMILNPSLQKKLVYIEAIALDCEKADDVEDHTVINCDEINAHCGDVLNEFKDYFGLESQTNSKASKESVDVESYYRLGKLNTLTLPVLKAEAKTLRIKLNGTKKNDIIDAIKAHFDKKK